MTLDGGSIGTILEVYRPERAALLDLLRSLAPDDWSSPTECPAYDVQGIATHVLGDDLSLLSRQRDAAPNGLIAVAEELPGADFRTLLDTFNDRWVSAAAFLSTDLLCTLLELTGEWTAAHYEAVDPEAPGEPVGFFGASGPSSPFWHAIAREYVERWIHHSQILRALGRPSLADPTFLDAGIAVVGAAFALPATIPTTADAAYRLGPIEVGDAQQTADILTRGRTVAEVEAAIAGPADAVALFASVAGRT